MASTWSPTRSFEESPKETRFKRAFGSGLQFKDGDVGQGIGADQFGFHLLTVRKRAEDAGGMAGNVMVGDQETVPGDDGAAAHRLAFDFAAFAEIGGNHLDADEGWPHFRYGAVNLVAQVGGGGKELRSGKAEENRRGGQEHPRGAESARCITHRTRLPVPGRTIKPERERQKRTGAEAPVLC